MKRNEIIELNGKEYTLELNRDSFLKIDQLCNIQKSMNIVGRGFYKYYDNEELTDDFDLKSLEIKDDEIDKEVELKEKTLKMVVERAFLIWLEPNHHLNISEVREILAPYFDDEKNYEWLVEKYGAYLQECRAVRESYLEERKNLKALADKK